MSRRFCSGRTRAARLALAPFCLAATSLMSTLGVAAGHAAIPAPVVVNAATETSQPASRKIAKVLELVYQIKTATDASAPKASYGSCFVIDPEGLLVTNFHVVAFALHEPDRYNLYLNDGEHPLPAEVVAFDVVNDLALVRVAKKFPRAVRFAVEAPETGAKIYSIGWPEDLNKSVIEGNFNGLMVAGPYQKYQMSIPLNPGMSGGPTINEDGEVVGVNVSMRADSQSLAFSVPRTLLEPLLRRARNAKENALDEASFVEQVRYQLDHVQEALTTLLIKTKSESIPMGGWQASKPASMVKCWREEESGARDLTTSTTETCYLPGSAPVRRDMESGTFRIKYQALEGPKLNAWQMSHHTNEALANSVLGIADYVEKFTTRPGCGELDVVNTRKVPLRVHYCVSAYVRYAELYNVEFELVTLGANKSALLVSASLLGFSSRNAFEIMRTLVNSVRPEPP